ncbi:mitogen-activated protein kinase kinase kinase 19 isoform X1 [Sorex araneus]|uniref:mitogen-activated protein kinase kinase kinase 19 isoform X1 n=1 Tax=Sorex araneus TaxID=42254 RepID=UPI0024334B6D|nr:mitogen-activated protein kinase kinase kinase 19 isoform X1 [Sorex araneus]
MNSIPKPEKHAESLLDICHDANSSPTDTIVTKNQNIILQSISSSEEFDQDDDCSLSLLASEEGDASGDRQDWQPRTEGVEIIVAFPRDVTDPQEVSQDFKENNQKSSVHREWKRVHSVTLANERKMVNFGTKMLTMPPSFLKKEESSRDDCHVNSDFLLPKPCLEPTISKSVAKEDVFHFLKGQQRKSEDFSSSDMKYRRRGVEQPLPPLSFLSMQPGLFTIPPSHKDQKERERNISSLISFVPKFSEPVSRSDEFLASNKQQEVPVKVFVDQTLRSSDGSIWSRNLCSFWKANHHRQHLGVKGDLKSTETDEHDKTETSHFAKRQSLVSFESFKECDFPMDHEVDLDSLGSEIRKAEEENSQYIAPQMRGGSEARNHEQDSEVLHVMSIKFQEIQHSERAQSQTEETRNDTADSKGTVVPDDEAVASNHIFEDFSELKALFSVVPHDPIDNKLPSSQRDMETNTKISIAETTKPEMNGLVPLIHITFPGEGTPKEPAITKPSLQKRKSALPNNSFNMLARQESDRHKLKTHRNKMDSKTKGSNKTPQNFMVTTTEGSTKPSMHKTSMKTQIFPALGLDARSRQPSKFQRRMPQIEKKPSPYRALKPKKQSFPCINKNSGTKKSSVQPTEPRPTHLDLKYSDMFKEINSTANGPGIYEMFGTPVYCHIREAERHENRHYRDISSAPLGRSITNKCRTSHSERNSNSRARLSQKRPHIKPTKPSLGIKKKHKSLTSEEKGSKAIGSNIPDIENDDGISKPEWQRTSSETDFLPPRDEVRLSNLTQTHEQPIEQNEFLPVSNLSIIEEISMEESPDEGDISNNQILASSLRDLHELEELHHQAPFFLSENSWVLPSEKNSNKQVLQKEEDTASLGKTNANQILPNDLEFDCVPNKPKTLISFSFQEKQENASPPLYQHWAHSWDEDSLVDKSVINQSFGQTLSDANPTSQEIVDSLEDEELTDELLGCLAAELLALDEKDNETFQIVANETDPENINLLFGGSENTREELVRETTNVEIQRYNNGFRIYDKEEKYLKSNGNKTFSENNLKCEEPTLWTKGEILGKGAYGTVYCGLTSQGQLIAVKQVALDTSDKLATEKEYRKLQEEVDLLKALNHVNIVAYLGTCLEENIVSIFMEFVPGGSISSIINRFGPLPEMVFCKYTKQILQGVAYLHENCVVHRDIKGNNVMLMPTGIIKLIDFGCARRLAWAGLNGTHSDMLKSMHGTPYWMAPEVINESGYGRKSDIWSIGCTVFEMATGKPPLASMDRMAAMFYIGAHRGLMPPLPEHFSEDAADFVHVCLTRDQHERPSAVQLLKHSFLKRNH